MPPPQPSRSSDCAAVWHRRTISTPAPPLYCTRNTTRTATVTVIHSLTLPLYLYAAAAATAAAAAVATGWDLTCVVPTFRTPQWEHKSGAGNYFPIDFDLAN